MDSWRVVFSSTGDLSPARASAFLPPPDSIWLARKGWRVALDSLAAVLFPSDCRICHHPLVRLSRLPVCDQCLGSLSPVGVTSCEVCGEAIAPLAAETMPVCGMCRRAHPHFSLAIAYGAYDGELRRLLHLLKYEGLRPAAVILGGKLAEGIALRALGRKPGNEKPVLVIPVPLHRSKLRQRGFNQAELIARMTLRRLDRSWFELCTGNLSRLRATVSQTGLTRHQRRANVRGAFVVSSPERLRGRSVLLIDDVYTTGTTLNECARVLRAAGASDVAVATVARVYRSLAELAPSLGRLNLGTLNLGKLNQEEDPVVRTQWTAAG